MTYAVKRSLGFQPWGVVNPWGFANLAQPQRRRVPSYYVWQTHPHTLRMHHLGGLLDNRETRMEMYSLIGLALTTVFVVRPMLTSRLKKNRRRRRR
jgi:hypothetical protein